MPDSKARLFQKKIAARILVIASLCISLASAQTASDYFPSHAGNVWRYQRFSLDTLQNPIITSKTIVSDSLAGTLQVKGLQSYILLSQSKSDTTFVNVQGSSIEEFVTGYPHITSMLQVDSLGLGFVWDYLDWYPYMKFDLTQGVSDTLLYIKNKTVAFQGHALTLVIYVTTTRLPDTSVTVPAGMYVTTPFQIALFVNIPKSQPPFGHYEVPLFKLVDTIFIAKNNWLVKEIQPSTFYPLNNDPSYQVATTQLPGFVRLLESASLTSVPLRTSVPREFTLEQNFPNPFNPATHLRFTIGNRQFVSLKVFDVLGEEITTLVNDQLSAGAYDLTFDGDHLPSGVYFYRLTADGMVQTKKMILQK